jgi:hypothetical protein
MVWGWRWTWREWRTVESGTRQELQAGFGVSAFGRTSPRQLLHVLPFRNHHSRYLATATRPLPRASLRPSLPQSSGPPARPSPAESPLSRSGSRTLRTGGPRCSHARQVGKPARAPLPMTNGSAGDPSSSTRSRTRSSPTTHGYAHNGVAALRDSGDDELTGGATVNTEVDRRSLEPRISNYDDRLSLTSLNNHPRMRAGTLPRWPTCLRRSEHGSRRRPLRRRRSRVSGRCRSRREIAEAFVYGEAPVLPGIAHHERGTFVRAFSKYRGKAQRR